jgi:hypothetical protein
MTDNKTLNVGESGSNVSKTQKSPYSSFYTETSKLIQPTQNIIPTQTQNIIPTQTATTNSPVVKPFLFVPTTQQIYHQQSSSNAPVYKPENALTPLQDPFYAQRRRFLNIAKYNPDMLPSKYQRRHQFFGLLNGMGYITLFAYFLVKTNRMYDLDSKSKWNVGFKCIAGLILINIASSAIYSFLIGPAFDVMFGGMSQSAIDADLQRFKENSVYVRY